MSTRTEHPKDRIVAGSISLGVAVALFLFLFYFTITTRNPPFDLMGSEGMEMNFGTYNEGTGEVENDGIGDATNVVTAESVSTPTPTSENNVETFENGEPVVNADPKNPTPKTESNTTVITPVKPSNTNNSLLNNFIKNGTKGGNNGGDGSSGTAGNDGVPDGNPNTNGLGGTGNNPNQIGSSTGTGGISLTGRKIVTKPCPVNDSKEEGTVVVTIKVNKEGKVVEADPNGRGTTTSSSVLKSKARQAALCAKFSPSEMFDEQVGNITFKFEF